MKFHYTIEEAREYAQNLKNKFLKNMGKINEEMTLVDPLHHTDSTIIHNKQKQHQNVVYVIIARMDPGGSRRVELKAFDKPQKSAEVKPIKLAVRFEIKLEESTDEKCPEISYTDLLLKHERKRKRTNSTSLSATGLVNNK